MSDGREVRIPEQFPIMVRKVQWDLNVTTFANVSLVRTFLYGAQRIVNDAAGSGTRAEQQANAKERLHELQTGTTPTRAAGPRVDTVMKEAIKIAIAREVRPLFKAEGRKQIWADMVARAEVIVAGDSRYLDAARATIAAAAAQRAANEQFFSARPDVDVDTSDAVALLEFAGDESDEDVIDAAEAA